MHERLQSSHSHSPILITRQSSLRQLAERLAGESLVAVDTESNSLYAYQEQVCLVQFSTAQEDFLVDPLALDDLSALAPLFADPKIEKIFHAAEYDLITMKRDFGFSFVHLFDTMLAARILGWEEIGLGSILKAEFAVQLDKRYQRANWGKRPLPSDMLNYARLDTHYLIPLRHRLKSELKAKDRWQLAEEDFNRLRFVNGRDPDDQPEACWRVRGAFDLSPEQAAILQEICSYREQVARSIDQPVFKVISDQTLLEVAAAAPTSLEGLQRATHLSSKQFERYGKGLLGAVQRGLQAEPLRPPRQPRPDEAYLMRVEALREWRKHTGQQMGVNSDVILPRDLLFALASLNQPSRAELSAILTQTPYRLERFGEQILAVLENN
jgi:ribonuclease D